MKVLICDDDIDYAYLISEDFKSFFHNKLRISDVDVIDKDFHFYMNKKYDICFMDIDLNNQNGIKIVKKMKEINSHLIVIFVSAREELVFNTFSVEPFQFIRKNHYRYDMRDTLEQLEWKLKKQLIKITIKDSKRYISINPKDIFSVISIEHDIIINTQNNTYYSTGTLKRFYETKFQTNLVQIQKNLIINIEKILSVNKNIIFYEDEKEYLIGRVYREAFKKKYEEYLYL